MWENAPNQFHYLNLMLTVCCRCEFRRAVGQFSIAEQVATSARVSVEQEPDQVGEAGEQEAGGEDHKDKDGHV